MKKLVRASGHQIGQTAGREFGMVFMTTTLTTMFVLFFAVAAVVFSVEAFMGGGQLSVKICFALSALKVVSVTVLGAAGAFIRVFHDDSPCYDDCGVCGGGAPWDTAASSR